MNSLRLIVPVLAAALGCIEAFVDVPIGPVNVTIALPVQAVPAALLDTNGALRRLACSAAAPCPLSPLAPAHSLPFQHTLLLLLLLLREPGLAQPGGDTIAMGEQHARQFVPVGDVDVEGRLA